MGLFASLFGRRRRRRATYAADSVWLYSSSTSSGSGPHRNTHDDNPRGQDGPATSTGANHGHHAGHHHSHDHSGHSHSDSSSSHDSGSSGGDSGGGGGDGGGGGGGGD